VIDVEANQGSGLGAFPRLKINNKEEKGLSDL
jgi:hypothetical protein